MMSSLLGSRPLKTYLAGGLVHLGTTSLLAFYFPPFAGKLKPAHVVSMAVSTFLLNTLEHWLLAKTGEREKTLLIHNPLPQGIQKNQRVSILINATVTITLLAIKISAFTLCIGFPATASAEVVSRFGSKTSYYAMNYIETLGSENGGTIQHTSPEYPNSV